MSFDSCFRYTLQIQWIGFHDIQSSIHHYAICISSDSDSDACDVFVNPYIVGKSITLSQLNLKDGLTYWANITAFNNVGLWSSSVSKPFTIDVTPPSVVIRTHLTTYSSLLPNTQFDGSYVSLSWKMTDDKTPMNHYTVSLMSHHDGEIPIENIHLGDITSVTLTLSDNNRLYDGTLYKAKVVGCNAAHLCSVSESEDFLVDSSPPLLGGFVEPMEWAHNGSGSTLDIAWEGFVDPHSRIDRYHITVSSEYNGFDLSGGVITISHNHLSYIQRSLVHLETHLQVDTKIYLSIWAQNMVGIMSDAAKASVFVLPQGLDHGRLEIEKHSCDVHYCTLDCTCAVVNQKCVVDAIPPPCLGHNATDDALMVFDGTFNSPISITPSTLCLPGYWMSNFSISDITRYEWSVGMHGHDPGYGVFDVANDKIWFDVESYDRGIYCLPLDEHLRQGESYVFHVRVWHGFSNYTLFQSEGVLVDSTPPVIGYGKHVLDTDFNSYDEIDFTTRRKGIFSNWDNVFTDSETGIKEYYVAVGYTSGGIRFFGIICHLQFDGCYFVYYRFIQRLGCKKLK